MKALLLSNSTMPGTSFFSWPQPWVKDFLGPVRKPLVFIPYAAVTLSFDDYFAKVREVFGSMGYAMDSLHIAEHKALAIREAGAIVVGGGNTFALRSRLEDPPLLPAIRASVIAGVPYVGWSAGANLACPTIMTTNDMPIVQPASFEALNIVPFQLNPHYHELKFEGQGGETRRERLEEFIRMNPGKKVIGLPEGMLLRVEGDTYRLEGDGTAKLYDGRTVHDLASGILMFDW